MWIQVPKTLLFTVRLVTRQHQTWQSCHWILWDKFQLNFSSNSSSTRFWMRDTWLLIKKISETLTHAAVGPPLPWNKKVREQFAATSDSRTSLWAGKYTNRATPPPKKKVSRTSRTADKQEFYHSWWKICSKHSRFCQSKRKAWTFCDTITLPAEILRSGWYFNFQMGPTGKSHRCNVRRSWWPFHWCPCSKPMLQELSIQPLSDSTAAKSGYCSTSQEAVATAMV
jgi:hypothetical protein